MRWDREVDVLVFGAGMGGMTRRADRGARRARRAAVREDRSGRRHDRRRRPARCGFRARARRCATACRTRSTTRGNFSPPRSARAPKPCARRFSPRARPRSTISKRAREVKFSAPPRHPDYHSNQPGRALAGRALAPLPFDGRLLGKDFARVRPPIAPFMVLGGMMVGKLDIPVLLKPFALGRDLHGRHRSCCCATRPTACASSAARAWSWATRWSRGCSTACEQRNVPIAFDARLVELVKGNGPRRRRGGRHRDKRQTIRARRGVILATGGFGAERETASRIHARTARSRIPTLSRARAATVSRRRGRPVPRSTTKHMSPAFYFPSSLHKDDRSIRTSCSTAPSPA